MARPIDAAAVLRTIAIAIAVAAIVDPAVKSSSASRPRLAIVATGTASAAVDAVRARLNRTLGRSHDIVPNIASDVPAAVVIGDRYPDQPFPADLVVATVTIAGDPPPVRIARLAVPPAVPAGTAFHVEADIEPSSVAGETIDFSVSIGGIDVARVSQPWPRQTSRVSTDVVPVGDPPWIVRAEVAPSNAREAGKSSVVHAQVSLRRDQLAVLVYEPRPSWAATFVRRALESDARFRVESVSVSSRGIAARTSGAVSLSGAALESFDLIVAGGLERLTTADVRALERFMRERGGAVALVPDARLTGGPIRELIPFDAAERLLERPESWSAGFGTPRLEASELLRLQPPAGADVVAAAADGSPIVVSLAQGRGRLLVSGAMDAWRFRGSAGRGFDRFWQAASAALALSAAPPIEVAVSPPVLRPLQQALVVVRLRSDAGSPVAMSVDGEPVRLWPAAAAGAYRATFTARATPGRMSVEAAAAGERPRTVVHDVVVQEGVETSAAAARPPLSLLSSSRRGVDVTPERLEELERFIRAAVTEQHGETVRRPMRAIWWLLPFLAALSGEWWIRRRRGLR